jgi:hypothetical protein
MTASSARSIPSSQPLEEPLLAASGDDLGESSMNRLGGRLGAEHLLGLRHEELRRRRVPIVVLRGSRAQIITGASFDRVCKAFRAPNDCHRRRDAFMADRRSRDQPRRDHGHGDARQSAEETREARSAALNDARLESGVKGRRAGVSSILNGLAPVNPTVRAADGEPGDEECQIDFADGAVADPAPGRNQVTHALIFTARDSRHQFVWLGHLQPTEAVIEVGEAAWPVPGVPGASSPANPVDTRTTTRQTSLPGPVPSES